MKNLLSSHAGNKTGNSLRRLVFTPLTVVALRHLHPVVGNLPVTAPSIIIILIRTMTPRPKSSPNSKTKTSLRGLLHPTAPPPKPYVPATAPKARALPAVSPSIDLMTTETMTPLQQMSPPFSPRLFIAPQPEGHISTSRKALVERMIGDGKA